MAILLFLYGLCCSYLQYVFCFVKYIRREQKEHAKIRECQSGLVELYEAFRLKKIVTGVWANESVERLNQLHDSACRFSTTDSGKGEIWGNIL